jgi:hypothetical protein
MDLLPRPVTLSCICRRCQSQIVLRVLLGRGLTGGICQRHRHHPFLHASVASVARWHWRHDHCQEASAGKQSQRTSAPPTPNQTHTSPSQQLQQRRCPAPLHLSSSRKKITKELEQSLQEAREQSGNTSSASAQANNSILTAQLRESGVALQERCASLAASVHAAEQEHRAVQQRLEEAVGEVRAAKAQLQGSAERKAAACARVYELEMQVAASDAAASAKLDRVHRGLVQECEELKALLSIERELSAEAAVDREAHEVE